jgi:GNAT superfamily N-acetyltransferase
VGMNEFDQLLEDMNQSPPSNPFDQMLDQQDTIKQRAIQSSAMVAADTQPDRRAEVMKLSERYKLAPELVENNFDTLSRKSKIESVQPDKLVRDHHGLSDWLSDPNNMALASDELDKLKDISETINEQGDFQKLYLALGSGFANMNAGIAKAPALAVDLYTQYAVNPMARALGYAEVGPNEALRNNAVANYFDKAAEGYQAQVPELSDKVIESALAGDFKKSSRALAFQVAANFPQMALTIGSTMAGAPGVGLAAMGAMSAAGEYDEALDKGVDQGAAMANAVIAGTAEAAFERMGTVAILKKWEASIGAKLGKDTARKIMADAGKLLGVSAIQEGLEETGTSIVQDTSKIVTGVNPDIGRMEMVSNAANAFVLGGAMGGSMVSLSGAQMARQRSIEMRQAQDLQDFYTALGDKTNELKLKQRLPEAAQKLIENLTKDGPVENIYVDPKDMQTYFQSKNLDPLEAATLYGFSKEYQEAVETGTDVKIPLAKWTTTMAETEHFQGLKDDVRFSPDGLSVRENQNIEKQLKADLKLIASQEEDTEIGKPEVELTPDQKRVRSARAVKDNVKQQLLALNSPLYGPNEAEQVALLYAKGFNSLGYRSGIDPLELFNRYGLRISLGENGQLKESFSSPGDTVMAAQGQVLNQRPIVNEKDGDLRGEIKGKGEISGTLMSADGAEFWFEGGNKTIDDVPYSEFAILEHVEVDPSARRQGVASRLVKDFERKAKQSGAEAIYLNASPVGSNQVPIQSLRSFYESMGFEVFDDMGTNVVMVKDLRADGDRELFQSAAQAVADVFPTKPSPPTFSKLIALVEQKMGGSADPQQIRAMLKEIKEEEKKWLGVEEFLAGKEKVKKQDFLDFLRANEPEIVDVTLGGQGALNEGARVWRFFTEDGEWLATIANEDNIDSKRAELASELEVDAEEISVERGEYSGDETIEDEPDIPDEQRPTKYQDYTLPGGENYREVLFTLPVKTGTRETPAQAAKRLFGKDSFYDLTEDQQKVVFDEQQKQAPVASYTSSHFPQKDILAHVRLKDRTDADGKKVLFVEEIQSDWHQDGRKKGYVGPEDADLTELPPSVRIEEMPASETGALSFGDQDPGRTVFNVWDGGRRLLSGMPSREEAEAAALRKLNRERQTDKVPDAPFKKTWHEYAFKRIVRMAAEGGYDRIAWAPGVPQAERYNLSKQIESVSWNTKSGYLAAYDHNGNEAMGRENVKSDEIADYIGKEAAERLLKSETYESGSGNPVHRIEGEQLNVGGDGMKGFYDKILVDYAKKLGKKFGATVAETRLAEDSEQADKVGKKWPEAAAYAKGEKPVHSLDVTDKMRDVAIGEGFELFQSKPLYGKFTPPANVKTATINSLGGETISMDQARAAVLGTQESIEAKLPGGGTVLITKDTFGKSTFESGVRDLTPEEKQASAIIAKNLPSLLEDIVIDAQERNYKPDLKPHVKDYRRFYGVVEIDGSEYAFHLKTERPVKGQKARFKHERVYFEFARKLETPSRNAEANSSEGSKVNPTVRPLKNSPGRTEISIGEFAEKINSVRASDPLFQSGEAEDSNRARIVIGANKTMRIELFAKADLSSFLHETGHFYLEVLADLAKDPRANPQLVADYNTAIKELGGEPGGPITVEMHEKWARAFELYLAKGEAPSLDLKKAFAHFKVWLINVYKNLRRLDVELTPEIKGVMDRLLATDAELEAAYLGHPPLFKGDAFDGMNPETAEKYQRAIDDAKQEASESLTAKVVEREFKKREAAYKEKRKAVRARVEEEANGLRIYRALSILQKGTLPDGSALPEGTPQIKIDKQSIVQAYGKEFLDRLPRPFVYAKEGGVDYNMAAEMLGFESGDAMLTEMANAQTKKAYIESRTDEEMDVLYPDEVMEQFPAEAVKAAHSEGRSKLLRMELELLVQNNMPVFKDAIRRVARRVPTEAEVRAQARQLIAGKRIAEIKPYTFERAEIKSAKEAGIALAKGDIEAAFEHKRKELLNHELFRAANEAIEEHEKALEFFKKFGQKDEDLAKSRDMDLVNAGRAILSEYDIGKSDKTREEILKYMQAYAPESYESISTLIDSVGLKPGNFDEITHEEFSKLNETVRAIWSLSRQAKNIEIDGKKVAREEIKAELVAQIDAIKQPGQRLGYDKAVSDWEKTKLRLQGMKAALRRVESWVSAVDGEFGGPFRKYIWQPISDATAIYRSEKVKVLTQLQDSIKQWQKESEITTAPIKSSLGYTFAGKAELMAAVLHTGNKSNMEKLLIGRGWGQILEDGSLDTSRWDEFMLSMYRDGVITKADMDFAQRVWDLNESLKPAAQKAHKEMYGFYFNEVTADEIQTPFGNYRGGYVPAITDPTMVEDAAIRQEQEAVLKGNNSFMFPTTGRGFTKSRVEQYHAPLMLDLKLTGSHIDKVLRFIHIEPRVKEVSRIVMDKKFRASLAELDPTIGQDMLVPWLQRAAQQAVSTPSKGWAGKGLDTFARELRKRAGLQAMFFNVTNTFQQVTGFSIAFVRVKPKYVRNAIWRYIQSPKAFAEDVNSKSKFMETRTGTQMVDINQTIEEIALNTSKFDDVRSYVQKHGYFMQSAVQNVVDLTVWAGAYEEATVGGMAEAEAVRFADSAVRETQGSMAPEDISRFEAGSPFVRLFTMFQGYFNMQANLLGTEFAKTAREMGLRKGAGRLFYVYVMGFMITAWMSELIVKAMGSGIDEDDDEQYLDDLLMSFFTSQFNTATAMFPVAGPAVRTVISAFNDKPYDDRLSLSPVVQSIERSAQAPVSVYNAIVNDGSKRKAVRDAMSAVGMLSGIPTGIVQRPLSYLADVDEGKADPTGPVDFTRGLISGNPGTPQ